VPRDAVVTYEEVSAAAQALQAAGQKPSTRHVRERLGNVGSMGTIHKLLQQWRGTASGTAVPPVTLPAPLQRALLEFVQGELSNAQAGLAQELATSHQEAAELASENERHAATGAEQAARIAALAGEVATQAGRITQLEQELAAARGEASQARERGELERLERARAELRLEALPRLESDSAALRAEVVQERKGRVAAEQQAAVLQARLDGALERVSKADAAAARAVPGPPRPAPPVRKASPPAGGKARPGPKGQAGASPRKTGAPLRKPGARTIPPPGKPKRTRDG
jgi:hypothetical protein